MVLTEIAYTLVLGKPVIQWLGSATFLLLLATASGGFLARRGKFNFKYHHWLAYLTLLVALSHGLLTWL